MDDPDRWQRLFVQRMRALFEANGQPAPELSLDGEAADAVGFTVDGVDFEISFHAPRHRDHLLLECEFGAAPKDEWALRKLLRLNRRLQLSGRGSFGWRREADAITFGMQLPLAQCEKDTIEAVMAAIAQQAHHWRAGRPLDEDAFPEVEAPEAADPPLPSETDVRSQLVRVLQELCEDERVDAAEELEAPPQALALRISMGDAEVLLVHADSEAQRLTLECDYGAAPIDEPVDVLLGLLESTDAHATGGADGFGLEEPADLVMYRRAYLGRDWMSEELLAEILDIARSSTEWFDACWGTRNSALLPPQQSDELVNVLN
jgi:hypothetical protein